MENKNKPEASVIIPSRDGYRGGNVQNILKKLEEQSLKNIEIIIVVNAVPCSRAHNIGVENARSDNIIFIDDDIRIKNNCLVENLVDYLKNDRIGICGASQVIPPDSNSFQKKCAVQIPRAEFHEVKKFTENDMATHACMAIRRQIYMEAGKENENMFRNDDSYLRYNVRKRGLKIGVIPHAVVYHSMPENYFDFLRKKFNNGKYYSYDYRYYPEFILYTPVNKERQVEKSNFLRQVLRNFKILLTGMAKGEFLLISGRICMWLGVLYGFLLNRRYFDNKKKKEDKLIKYYIKKDGVVKKR